MKKYIFLLSLFWAIATLVSAQNISRLEYSIDGFVAEGKGTPLEISGNETEINSMFDIDISGLEPGIHTILFRSMNENGIWSFPAERTFYIPEPPITEGIVAIEYSIDKILKEGSGEQLKVDKATNWLDSSFVFDIAGLEAGTHNIYFRAKNKFGKWSMPANRAFVVVKPDTVKVEKIYYRFYNDGYQSSWMMAEVDPARKNLDSTIATSVTGLDLGEQYTIELFAKNSMGVRGFSTFLSPVDLQMNNAPISLRDSLTVNIMVNELKGISMDSLFNDQDLAFGDHLAYSISNPENPELMAFSKWVTPSIINFSPDNNQNGKYQFWLTASDVAWEKDSIKVILTVSGTTGIESQSWDKRITVYPNPATNYTTIKVNSYNLINGYLLKLYNSTGQLLKTEFVTANDHRLNLDGLTKGLYFLLMESNDFRVRKKILHE